MNEYFDLKHIYQQHRITISPDGKYVSFVLRTNKKLHSRSMLANDTNIVILELETETYIYPLGTDIKSWAPSWSSDSRCLAFYSHSDNEAFLNVWDSKTKKCFKITETPIRGYYSAMSIPRWLNFHTICVPFIPEHNWLYHTDPALNSDNDKYFKIRSDIGIVDVVTKTEKRIPSNFNAKLIFPSPNGKRLAISTFEPMKNIGRYMWAEGLYYYDIETDTKPYLIDTELPLDGGGRHVPVWSCDSNKISYLKNTDLKIYDISNKKCQTIDLQDENPDRRFLALCKNGHIIRSANSLYFVSENDGAMNLNLPENQELRGVVKAADSDHIVSVDNNCLVHTVDTASNKNCVFSVPLDGGSSKCLMSENKTLMFSSFSIVRGSMCDVDEAESKVVYCVESINSPLELWISDIEFNKPRQLTALNSKIDVDITHKIVFWNDTAGNERKGVIFYPSGCSSSMPLVVSVYPGVNHTHEMNSWQPGVASAILPLQLMVAKGYAVFAPDLVINDKVSLRKNICDELLLSMESVYEYMNIDKNRIFLIGNSFGGYSVNCIITQTDIFKAAVSSAGFSNLSSMYATNYNCQVVETGQIGIGTPWDNSQGYIENSPLFYANNIETPLLIIDGEKEDMKNQPDEMRVALTRLNKKVKCLYFKDEGHAPMHDWSVDKQIICAKTVLDWFDDSLNNITK